LPHERYNSSESEPKKEIPVKAKLIRKARTFIASAADARSHDSLLLQGRMASWKIRSMESVRSLQDVEFRVFSQWGEDGIIDWLIERAAIPPRVQTFIEFGVGNYAEANTRFLLENRNWRGLVMDGDPNLFEDLKRDAIFWKHDLKARSVFITRENINQLLADAGFSGDIGLLNIDLDGNDYWIWKAIDAVRPILCICEYNAVFGNLHAVSVPYDPAFLRGQSHFSHLYFGASIAALRSLGAQKGYRFLGTTLAGNDAFFVREDYAPSIDGAIHSVTACPSKCRESRDPRGCLSHIGGRDRFDLISDLPVVLTDTGETVTLKSLGPVYSEDWL
jgi:hypothetical protein